MHQTLHATVNYSIMYYIFTVLSMQYLLFLFAPSVPLRELQHHQFLIHLILACKSISIVLSLICDDKYSHDLWFLHIVAQSVYSYQCALHCSKHLLFFAVEIYDNTSYFAIHIINSTRDALHASRTLHSLFHLSFASLLLLLLAGDVVYRSQTSNLTNDNDGNYRIWWDEIRWDKIR